MSLTQTCVAPLDKRAKGKAVKTHRRKVTGADLHILLRLVTLPANVTKKNLKKETRKDKNTFQNGAASLIKTVFLLPLQSSSSGPSSSSSKTDEDIDSSETRSSADESALEEEVATQENTVGSSTPDSSSSSWSTCSSSSSSPPPEDAMTLGQQDFSEHNWPIPDTLFSRFQVSPDHHTGETLTPDGYSWLLQVRVRFSLPPLSFSVSPPDYDDANDIIEVSSRSNCPRLLMFCYVSSFLASLA